ncbi:hypothetical protein SFRURICE_004492 [Spodoptera frugiperda]|nr:hypothetical protein SFRURICE_004492 [Spodoptera frugiperda]
MSEQVEIKPDALPDLDDLLQCPVCYEIPSGQIFQCNEGHHVCGRCKMRLDVCPVCRALFFGTRNYAMEELIANVRKLRAFKLGGKVTTDTGSGNKASKTNANEVPETESVVDDASEQSSGKSENGEYVQAWQFSTVPGRIVTAVRVADMGIFFLIIDIGTDTFCAWLSMAASPWVAHEFSYTITISGNDREAIFSDCVWSVRSCEGSLKKRGHCLTVNGLDARALVAPASICGKLSVRRTPPDQLANQSQPRAVLRVANRVNNRENTHTHAHDLEPFLQDLQNDVARLSRAFATLGREANALVRSEAEMRARIENRHGTNERASSSERENPVENNQADSSTERAPLSRNARRRMRQRLRAALNAPQPPVPAPRAVNGGLMPTDWQNGPTNNANVQRHVVSGLSVLQQPPVPPPVAPTTGVPTPPVAPQSSSGTPSQPQNGNARANKKKRRHRR